MPSPSNIARDEETFGPVFKAWPKISREPTWLRVTEKLDGTNAAVIVDWDTNTVAAQSRTRIITPGKSTDNYGFAARVQAHKHELMLLGPGHHFGEWWGQGIQRTYGLEERRFSLFGHWYEDVPACCHKVPELYRGEMTSYYQVAEMGINRMHEGSVAAPGYALPEGIIVEYHSGRDVLRQKVIINECRGGKG